MSLPDDSINKFIIADSPARLMTIEQGYKFAEHLGNTPSNSYMSDSIDVSERLLRDYFLSTANKKMLCSFLSVDLRGFTALSHKKDIEDISKLITTFSSSVSILMNDCGGYVLKYVGDAVLGYFPAKELKSSVNRAIIAGASISRMMDKGLLQYFQTHNIRTHYGIGIDAGEVAIVKVGSPSSKLHYDLLGKPINVSVKLQSMARMGEIIAGQAIYDNAPKQLKENFKEYKAYENHPSGIKAAIAQAGNIVFRHAPPEKIYQFNPPEF